MSAKGPITIGEYELWALSAGSFRLDGGAMFGVVPKTLWSKLVEPDDQNRIIQPLACLLIRGGGKTWLVETGIGNKLPEKMQKIYSQEGADALDRSLQAAGVSHDEVDGVIVTHLHQDHVGGATRLVDGKTVLSFPNARIYAQRAEWEDALGADGQTAAGYRVDENIEPLEKAGVVELLDGDSELAKGIRVEASPGHTRGHQSVFVEGDGQTACFIGDLVPSRNHMKAIYIMAYDIYPRETFLNKQRLLARAVDENWLAVLSHDTAPWGRVSVDEQDAFTFTPEDA